jgi:hypothetical protein
MLFHLFARLAEIAPPDGRSPADRFVAWSRAASARTLWDQAIEQTGPGKEAENSKERRGMRIGFSGQLIAAPWPGGKQVGNSELHDNVDGLRDAVAADQIEDFAKVMRRRSVN